MQPSWANLKGAKATEVALNPIPGWCRLQRASFWWSLWVASTSGYSMILWWTLFLQLGSVRGHTSLLKFSNPTSCSNTLQWVIDNPKPHLLADALSALVFWIILCRKQEVVNLIRRNIWLICAYIFIYILLLDLFLHRYIWDCDLLGRCGHICLYFKVQKLHCSWIKIKISGWYFQWGFYLYSVILLQ